MEGLPSGDIQVKYKKLAAEYTKVKTYVKVLKKGVLDEQSKSTELRELLKEKEKCSRKNDLEIDSLTFRNQQLTKRISVLQDELDSLQLKLTRKGKHKDEKQPHCSSFYNVDSDVLQEELQKKINENVEYASQLSDRTFEVAQLKSRLEDLEKEVHENESKYKCEIAKLKNQNNELHHTLETSSYRDRNSLNVTNKASLPVASTSSHQIPTVNGDFVSEGGSYVGSEDALSSVDELNVNEELKMKSLNLEQENEKLKMEYELLRMDNETLKLTNQKLVSLSERRHKDSHDSGDFNAMSNLSVSGDGVLTGLLGKMEVPFILGDEILQRENNMIKYFRNKLSESIAEKQLVDSTVQYYSSECEAMQVALDEAQKEKESMDKTILVTKDTISRLEDELHSTTSNYKEQMEVLTEHVGNLNDKISQMSEEISDLKAALKKKK